MHFVNGEMGRNWYMGNFSLNFLAIRTKELHAIYPEAFDDAIFDSMTFLEIYVTGGSVRVFDGSLDTLDSLRAFYFTARTIKYLPMGMLDACAKMMAFAKIDGWSNNVNLNEMFANKPFSNLEKLQIKNVQWPQTKFRLLAADNFTAFRRLRALRLIKCGIEMIDEHAFDGIASTLVWIKLNDNRIKSIDLSMFRRAFETKKETVLKLDNNQVTHACSCQLIELEMLLCPFLADAENLCVDCDPVGEAFDDSTCGVYRDIDIASLCVRFSERIFMRTVTMRVAYADDDSIRIAMNFTNKFRVIMVNGDAVMKNDRKCTNGVASNISRCISLTKFTERIDLNGFAELRDAELAFIAVVPILYRFGARPSHAITGHRKARGAIGLLDRCILAIMAVAFAMSCFVLGLAAGLGIGSLRVVRKKTHDDVPTMMQQPSHEDHNEYIEVY